MFEKILLEQEQMEFLSVLVEAARNMPREQRQKFMSLGGNGSTQDILVHPGLPDGRGKAYIGDVEVLAREGLIALSYDSHGTPCFDVTPLGFKYYKHMKRRTGRPVQRIETKITDYLDADHFRQKYSKAYQKWTDAETMLWSTDSERQLTTVGHLCREAIQEFATALVNQYQPPNVDTDKAHDMNRIRAVLDMQSGKLGSTEKPFLDTLLAYWRTVSNLIQRQEHGGQKEGQSLVWEDGRRVVFQTAVVMFEIDSSLSRTH